MPTFDRNTDPSLRALEALRGYASVVVLLHHFALAFLPGLKPLMNLPILAYTLGWVLNGMGAVYVFFVLSGFVLVLRYYRQPQPIILLIAALKRLPRLWPSALYGTMLAYLMLRFALHANVAAADLSGSQWLRSFADADRRDAPGLISALRESVEMFLRYRPLRYNTNLWTMLVEFYGSLLAFFAAMVFLLRSDRGWVLLKLALVAALIWVNMLIPYGFGWAFTSGAVLAYAYSKRLFVPRACGLVLILLGLCLLGSPAPPSGEPSPSFSLPGAVLLLWGMTTPRAAPGFLCNGFSQMLGRWSFPLYISHTVVILSFGSLTYLWTAGLGPVPQVLASFAVTLAFAVALAYPVLRWEAWYLPRLNLWLARAFASKR